MEKKGFYRIKCQALTPDKRYKVCKKMYTHKCHIQGLEIFLCYKHAIENGIDFEEDFNQE